MQKRINLTHSHPLPFWKGAGLRLLLLFLSCLCSVDLMSQADTDPFPNVNYRKYADNMTLFAQVRIGKQVLGDGTIVAVYVGDEIRGKGTVTSRGKYTNIVKFNITGDKRGEALHFKVFTEGRVIEVDNGDRFVTNGAIGSAKDYYFIDLPAPVVTTFSDEGWATTCLPFNTEIPKDVKVFVATGIKGCQLKLTQPAGTILQDNTPVLVQGNAGTSCEWFSRVAKSDISSEGNIFLGTTESTTVEANQVLTLGHADDGENELGFWRFTGNTIPANRAYIANAPAGVRGLSLWFDDESTQPTAVTAVNPRQKSAVVYDLQGRRLPSSARPRPGTLLISDGRKFISK